MNLASLHDVLQIRPRTLHRAPYGEDHKCLGARQVVDVVAGDAEVDSASSWAKSPGESSRWLRHQASIAAICASALGLVPLKLEEVGMWEPKEHYWGEDDEPLEEWAKAIFARGPRPGFEMEQVLPGEDIDDPFDDPITRSNDLKDIGDQIEAEKLLMGLCESDLRCLDAHAHLGNLVFERRPEDAIRHYEVGVRIGELSLGDDFDGVLLWGHIDNRPFLRCMQGYGLCLWRMAQPVRQSGSAIPHR
ncbi:MAG: hypothetical protein JRH14_22045 [Deltaproteobacteria bacterium]|nr:hypothetical protein [Deltaproteobacteria bacterium]